MHTAISVGKRASQGRGREARRWIALVAVLALVAGGCTDDDEPSSSSEGSSSPSGLGEPGILLTAVTGNTATVGAMADFTVVLASAPAAEVVVPVASSDEDEGIAEPATLTFTTEDWSTPQAVVVRGTNDDVEDGTQDYRVEVGPATSEDPDYDGLDPDDVELRGVALELTAPAAMDGLVAQVPVELAPEVLYTGTDLLSFSLEEAPDAMEIDATSGQISWTPGLADEGRSTPVTVAANDGTRSAEVDFELEVLEPDALETEVAGGTVSVDDEAVGLAGVSITAVEDAAWAETLDLGTIEPDEAPALPDEVAPLSDVMVVRNAHGGDVELRYPLDDLPDGVSFSDVELYALGESDLYGASPVATPDDERTWSSVAVDTTYEGTSDAPVLVVSLAGIEGLMVFGYGAADADANADATSTTVVPTTTAAGTTACTQQVGPEPDEVPLRHFDCTTPRGTVTVRDWGSAATDARWGGTTLPDLIGHLTTAQDYFAEHQLAFSPTFTVQIEEEEDKPADYGWVRGALEDRQTLHLAYDIPGRLLPVVTVHEYFHHVQGQPGTEVGQLDLLWNAPGGAGAWLLEGSARWFEDELFDDVNSYAGAEAPGDRIAEVGLAASWNSSNSRNRPYQRFAFVKLLKSKCPGFDPRALFSSDQATDPTGLDNLTGLLSGWSCDFGDQLGADRNASLAAALAYYQYASQVAGRMSLLDSDEADTFAFKTPLALEMTQVTVDGAEDVELGLIPLPSGVPIAAGGALTLQVPAVGGTVPEGQVVELVVTSGQELLVSVVGATGTFAGTTTIGDHSASWFSTPAAAPVDATTATADASTSSTVPATTETTFTIPGTTAPELFVTIVNPSLDRPAKGIGVRVRTRAG